MDSHNLDFPDENFDLVISRNVAWTLSDPEKRIKKQVHAFAVSQAMT
jgi:hypothetical protein